MELSHTEIQYDDLEPNKSAIQNISSNQLQLDTSLKLDLIIENGKQPQKSYKYNSVCESLDNLENYIKSDDCKGYPIVNIKCDCEYVLDKNESILLEVSLATTAFKIHPFLLKSDSKNRLILNKEDLLKGNTNSNLYRYYYIVNIVTFECVLDSLSIVKIPEHMIKEAIELEFYRREQEMGRSFKDPVSFLADNHFKKYGDLNVCRLKLQLVLYNNEKREFVKYLTNALYTDLISDTKNELLAKTLNTNYLLADPLRIISCSRIIGSMYGNDMIIIFTNELDDIQDLAIEFYQIENNSRVWEETVYLKQENIHNKCAIWFRTPKYNEQLIIEKQSKTPNYTNNHTINYKHLIKEHPIKVTFRLIKINSKEYSTEWPFYYAKENCTILNHFNIKQLSELRSMIAKEDGDSVMQDRNLNFDKEQEDDDEDESCESTDSDSCESTDEDEENESQKKPLANHKNIIQTKRTPKQEAESQALRALVLDRKKKMNALADRTALSLIEISKTRSLHKVLKTQRYLLNTQNRDGNTPLHLSLLNGNFDLLEIIVDCALTIPHYNIINVKNNYQLTVLLLAARLGEAEVCEFLLEANTMLNDTDLNGNNCFHIACQRKDLKLVKILVKYIKRNIDKSNIINVCNYEGETPLQIACRLNCYEIIEELIYAPGCRIEEKNKRNGMNALHYTAYYNCLQVTKLLLEYVTSSDKQRAEKLMPHFIDAQANNGCTPLHVAIANSNYLIVRLLRKYKANPYMQSIEFAHPKCEETNMKAQVSKILNSSLKDTSKKHLNSDTEKLSEDIKSSDLNTDSQRFANKVNSLYRHNYDAYNYANSNSLMLEVLHYDQFVPKYIVNEIIKAEYDKKLEKLTKNEREKIKNAFNKEQFDYVNYFENRMCVLNPHFKFNTAA